MRCTARRLITGFAAIAAASLTVSLTPLAALPAQAAPTRPSASAQLAAAQAAAVKQATQAAQAGQAAAPTPSVTTTAPTPTAPGASSALVPLPGLPTNACNNASLPADYGTNFPTPSDPNGFGFANQTAIGWTGNYYAPFEYLSGSYFARGVPDTYKQGSTSYCGQMYSFGAYTYGLASGTAPAAGSVHWSMANGYLPAMITSFTRNDVAISITDFADQQTIGGSPVELVYTRISVTNHGTAAVSVPPGATGSGLVELDTASADVAPGATVNHDFVAPVDTFGSGQALPTVTAATSAGPSNVAAYAAAYAHMAQYWEKQVSVAPTLSLPNVSLANTNNLADPGTAIDNAYKAAFVYTRIVQTAESAFSGGQQLRLAAEPRRARHPGQPVHARGLLRRAEPAAHGPDLRSVELQRVRRQLVLGRPVADPAGLGHIPGEDQRHLVRQPVLPRRRERAQPVGAEPLHADAHDYLAQLSATTGYLKRSNDNDSVGTWLFDDETALAGPGGLQVHRHPDRQHGRGQWADGPTPAC